ncbi:hypothetical protein [Pseudactinotalea terrae]|uniref:hypothetical protein n=1 Tax=Pseudactinotalea terrae TaxID=1743262 RepID=UPI0012E12C12|nr:hypothetical protein [Pseudactinotalea terrae]
MSDTTRNRQPAGLTTGGQFATEPKTETGLLLTGPDPQDTAVATSAVALAEALGTNIENVTIERLPLAVDLAGPGGQLVRVSAPDGDTTVQLSFRARADGDAFDLDARAEWETPELEDSGYKGDATHSTYDPHRTADPDTINALVADITRQARVQRAFDTVLNNPQMDALPASRAPYEVVRVQVFVVEGRTYLEVTDGGTPRPRPVRLRVEDSGIVAARVRTDYGDITVTDPQELDRVLQRLGEQLSGSLGRQLPQQPGRSRLESLLAEGFGRVG